MSPEPASPMNDDELLAHCLREAFPETLSGVAPDPAFREAVRHRTVALVRRRHHWRRLRVAAALLLAYGAGLATWQWLSPAPGPPLVGTEAPAAPPPAVEAELPAEPAFDRMPPSELEERAFASPRARRIELLRLAGDRYLGEGRDMESALRCYRAALNLMRPEERTLVSLQESWLFTALKSARS